MRRTPVLMLLLAAVPWLPGSGGRSAPPATGDSPSPAAIPWGEEPRGALSFAAEAAPVLVRDAVVFTGAGPQIPRGWVLVEDRRVAGVGAGDYPEEIGPDWLVVDAAGKWVTPGLVDPHSHMGVYPVPGAPAHSDGNEMVNPVTAGISTIHAFWPQDPSIERAVAGGVTTILALPGSANLFGGRGVVLKLHPRTSPQEMRLPGARDGLKMACGENPKRVYGERGGPQTRMGNMYRNRQTWIDAAEYARGWHAWEAEHAAWEESGGEEPKPPHRDLTKETLMGILDGDVLAEIHCYRADDMRHLLDLAEEFGWRVRAFHHSVEGYKIAAELAAAGTATVIWADWWGFKYEAYDGTVAGPAISHLAGVRVALHSDSATGIQRLNHHASQIYHEALDKGLPVTEEDAISWITANPAWVLGVEDSVGTLEAGKMGDLVVWSHHPLSVLALAELVIADGEVLWDRTAGLSAWSDFEAGQWTRDPEVAR